MLPSPDGVTIPKKDKDCEKRELILASSGCEKPRIMFICVSLRGGGTERVVSRLANHLSHSASVSVTTVRSTDPFYQINSAISLNQPPDDLGDDPKPLRLLRQIAHLARACRREKPNCCLVFGEDIAGAVVPIARAAGARSVVMFLRGTPARSLRGLNGILNPLSARLALSVVVQTNESQRLLTGRYPARKLEMLPNPVAIPEQVSKLDQREKCIINVGSIGRQKNQAALIRIFSRLPARSAWKLILVGDGPERSSLEAMVRDLGLSERVDFMGECKDVPSLLERSRIFAFTSLSEGFPNALAEALAAGCACISYDCPTGPADLIDNEKNGLLIPLGDEELFAPQLTRLIADEDLQARLSASARQDIQRFSENRVFEQFDSLISQVMNGHAKTPSPRCGS